MRRKSIATGMLAMGISISGGASAALVTYDIEWVGAVYPTSIEATLAGHFSIDAGLLGTGAITGDDLESLAFGYFVEGEIQGQFSLDTDDFPENFIFNFDTSIEELGLRQDWNYLGPGVGFASGTSNQFVSVDGNMVAWVHLRTDDPTLAATRRTDAVATVPVPGTIGLLASGLVGMGAIMTWRRRRRVPSTCNRA